MGGQRDLCLNGTWRRWLVAGLLAVASAGIGGRPEAAAQESSSSVSPTVRVMKGASGRDEVLAEPEPGKTLPILTIRGAKRSDSSSRRITSAPVPPSDPAPEAIAPPEPKPALHSWHWEALNVPGTPPGAICLVPDLTHRDPTPVPPTPTPTATPSMKATGETEESDAPPVARPTQSGGEHHSSSRETENSSASGSHPPTLSSVLVHFLSTLAAVVLGLGVFALGLVVVVRRWGSPLVLGLRTELPPPAVPTMVSLPQEASQILGVPFDRASETLELGPSYAEELRQREEAALQQDQAVLRDLFDQNLRLREQIATLGNS